MSPNKRAMEMHLLSSEIRLSYALLFTRSNPSKAIAERLFEEQGVEVQFINSDELDSVTMASKNSRIPTLKYNSIRILSWEEGRTPALSQFRTFRVRLATLKEEMIEWKAQKKWQL